MSSIRTCRDCGYDLAGHGGSEVGRCPECGLELAASPPMSAPPPPADPKDLVRTSLLFSGLALVFGLFGGVITAAPLLWLSWQAIGRARAAMPSQPRSDSHGTASAGVVVALAAWTLALLASLALCAGLATFLGI